MEKPLEGRLEGRSIGLVAGLLRSGGVAVLPTDTIYGFHCVYSEAAAIDRIRSLKGRSSEGFILLAATLEMADALVGDWPRGSRSVLGSLWPAPVTAILPASGDIPTALRPAGKVAVRIPSMSSLLDLIGRVGEPIVSTSANLSGMPPLEKIGEIKSAFPGLDAYISRRGAGSRSPSTIIDLTGSRPRMVRKGRAAGGAAAAFGLE